MLAHSGHRVKGKSSRDCSEGSKCESYVTQIIALRVAFSVDACVCCLIK